MAKGVDYVAKVARDLIKARRESGNAEKVYYSSWLWILQYINGMFSPLLTDMESVTVVDPEGSHSTSILVATMHELN